MGHGSRKPHPQGRGSFPYSTPFTQTERHLEVGNGSAYARTSDSGVYVRTSRQEEVPCPVEHNDRPGVIKN